MLETTTLNLKEVRQAVIAVNDEPVDPNALPTKGRFSLGFTLAGGQQMSIPFTDGEMAAQWLAFLRRTWDLS